MATSKESLIKAVKAKLEGITFLQDLYGVVGELTEEERAVLNDIDPEIEEVLEDLKEIMGPLPPPKT